jgi:hypothetical protein
MPDPTTPTFALDDHAEWTSPVDGATIRGGVVAVNAEVVTIAPDGGGEIVVYPHDCRLVP